MALETMVQLVVMPEKGGAPLFGLASEAECRYSFPLEQTPDSFRFSGAKLTPAAVEALREPGAYFWPQAEEQAAPFNWGCYLTALGALAGAMLDAGIGDTAVSMVIGRMNGLVRGYDALNKAGLRVDSGGMKMALCALDRRVFDRLNPQVISPDVVKTRAHVQAGGLVMWAI